MSKGKDGKTKDTGVRFSDIAGMDDIVFEMREVVKMMLGDEAYRRVGAKPPKVMRMSCAGSACAHDDQASARWQACVLAAAASVVW